jgi:hypothetical protein
VNAKAAAARIAKPNAVFMGPPVGGQEFATS